MSGNYRGPSATILADNNNIDGDKGDITVSNSAADWTINANVVTYAKMQQASTTDVLIGRATTGAGNLEEIPLTAAGRALLDDANAAAQRTTLGLTSTATSVIGVDVLAYDANLKNFVDTFTLPTLDGTNGQVLSTDGAGNLSLVTPGGLPDANYGDVTVSAGNTVWSINVGVVGTTELADSSVTTAKITDANVTLAKLATNSVDSSKIVDGTIVNGDIADATITGAKLVNSTLTDVQLANNAITTSKITDLNVTEPKLALQVFNDLTTVTFDADADYVAIADGSDSGNKKKALLPKVTNKLYDLDASVGTNALTITVNAGTWDFRSTTLTDGTPITRTLSSPVSVVVPDTATLGTVNATEAMLAVILLDNAGTLEAAVINIAGGVNLDERGLITTTTIGTGSVSALVAYSTIGRTNVAYRVIGYITITEATAGTWATAPSTVVSAGSLAENAINFNARGAAPMFAPRAWVNFNGTGTVAIRASGNVSSVTDNGVGDYTVNFTTAMPDENYSALLSGRRDSELGDLNLGVVFYSNATYLASSLRIAIGSANDSVKRDSPTVTVVVFR